jgi:hypothetical protein
MTKPKASSHFPWKPLAYITVTLVAGIALLWLSLYLKHKAATTQPAAVTASAPGDEPVSPGPGRLPRRPRPGTNSGLSSMILLFGVASLVACCVCVGWLVVEIRNRQPAWKRQTKYPKMRE